MKIRTLMIASFLLVAAFTPALALFSHQAVMQTEENAQQSIERSLSVINTSKAVLSSSEAILTDLNNIEAHLADDETPKALVDTRSLEENYKSFSNATDRLNKQLNGTSTGETLSGELQTLQDAENKLGREIEYASQSARTGSTISQEMIDELKPQYQNVASAAATINAEIVETESDNLISTQKELTDLSSYIVFIGGIVVFLSFGIAVIASIKLSRPIKQLSQEAEKMKKENFDEVKISDIEDSTDEIEELKDIMGQTLLALKSEFSRDRERMNEVAREVAELLEGQLPQGTAESSVTSACRQIGVDPTDLNEKRIDELADQLEMATRGLDVEEAVFDEIRNMKE